MLFYRSTLRGCVFRAAVRRWGGICTSASRVRIELKYDDVGIGPINRSRIDQRTRMSTPIATPSVQIFLSISSPTRAHPCMPTRIEFCGDIIDKDIPDLLSSCTKFRNLRPYDSIFRASACAPRGSLIRKFSKCICSLPSLSSLASSSAYDPIASRLSDRSSFRTRGLRDRESA